MAKDIARNEARQAIVDVTLVHLAQRGPANVHPKDICEELGLSKALVNYHFGGRGGLIAEAMVAGCERYVAELARAATSAGNDPVERLLAWVNRHVEWAVENPGLAAALTFPYLASDLPAETLDSSYTLLGEAVAEHDAMLHGLVYAAKTALRDGADVEGDDIKKDTALIEWMMLGASVATAGRLGSARQTMGKSDLEAYTHQAREHVRFLLGN